MRRQALLSAACCVTAGLVAACGASSHPHGSGTSHPHGSGSAASSRRRHPTRHGSTQARRPLPPTAAAIRRAAALTATAPGYSARISASVRLTALNGSTLTVAGSGRFDPSSHSGTLQVAIRLPGLLGGSGPLPTRVIVSGSEAYVRMPATLTHQFPRRVVWLRQSVAGLGLGSALDPAEILRDSARDATRHVKGQRAQITIDPRSGRVSTVLLRYAEPAYRVRVSLRFSGFGSEPVSPPPPRDRVAGLTRTLRALGL